MSKISAPLAAGLAALAVVLCVTIVVPIGSGVPPAPLPRQLSLNLDMPATTPQLAWPLEPGTPAPAPAPAEPTPPQVPIPAALTQALRLYATGDARAADALADTLPPGLWRSTAEWAALKSGPREPSYAQITHFIAQHPAWPSLDWLLRRAETALYTDKPKAGQVQAAFAERAPKTPAGKIALARALKAVGKEQQAAELVRAVWRGADLNTPMEKAILAEFAGQLSKFDHQYRASRLLYKHKTAAAMSAAALAGPDAVALTRARIAMINEVASDALVAAVPADLRSDAGLMFSTIQKLRRAEKFDAAAAMLLKAPHGAEKLVDGDEWWLERRLIARVMLDRGEAEIAYELCAQQDALSTVNKIDAEFHAGWIALRFLDAPATARGHFARLAQLAETPISMARAAFWLGRTQEALSDKDGAQAFYARAGRQSSTFYGQLARAKLGLSDLPLRLTDNAAQGDARDESIRIAQVLQTAGATGLANSLILDAAAQIDAAPQMAALAMVAAAAHDARLSLLVGKTASQRGFPLDDMAFPIFGVPEFQRLAGSADLALVYAIIRQESAFEVKANSGAGAKGLMQMMIATARSTAKKAGLAFDPARLTTDPAFNVQLGAAHLGTLLVEQRGSFVLAFAAYNAGGGRMHQWLKAHGDPRNPKVDVIDWIELIPIAETRNYVQRVIENLQVYRARLGPQPKLMIEADLHLSGSHF